MKKEVDHTNIFESYIGQDIFIADIIEKVVADWKRTERKKDAFNRDNLEDFFFDEFPIWVELGLDEWCDEEMKNGRMRKNEENRTLYL